MQVQGSARDHDPAVVTRDIVGEGDGRLARVGLGFGADFQFPVHEDRLGGQLDVGFVREAEFAVDSQAAQRRRTDVEEHILAFFNGDRVPCAGHLPVRPGGRIGPELLLDRLRSLFPSRRNDAECTDEEDCWNEQRKKERAILSSHVINPPYSKLTPHLRGARIFARLRYPPGLMRRHYSSSVDY